MNQAYVIGLDYGTDSVRALIVDALNGEEIATDVYMYPRWQKGLYCDSTTNQFRHHPLDYLEGLETTIKNCLLEVSDSIRKNIVGISVDTTGSTPCMINEAGVPLALLEEFSENPNGMFILWKDHTGINEADEINQLAKSWGGEDYTKYEGGVYSAEWFWSKILHVFRKDKRIREATFSAVELCDWIPAILAGSDNAFAIKRSRCAAGHKAMWHESWGGLPSEEFLNELDPILKALRKNLYTETYTSDKIAGQLCKKWAEKLGLSQDIVIGIGAFDAHMGALGAGIKPYSLVKILGTSTCDVLVVPKEKIGNKLIKGICGQVDGSVIPDLIGLEAGQSSFGDVYAWFKSILYWPAVALLDDIKEIDDPMKSKLLKSISDNIIQKLDDEAKSIPIDESGAIAMDWLNGRRTPDANQLLKGAIMGLSLGTTAPKIYRTLVEATAFGARKINNCFEQQGIPIKEIIGIGGVSKKSGFIMQVLADCLNRPIKICNSDQSCALGAAMCAATAAGIYKTIEDAQNKMMSGFSCEYFPIETNVKKYNALFERYCEFGSFVEKDCMSCKKLGAD